MSPWSKAQIITPGAALSNLIPGTHIGGSSHLCLPGYPGTAVNETAYLGLPRDQSHQLGKPAQEEFLSEQRQAEVGIRFGPRGLVGSGLVTGLVGSGLVTPTHTWESTNSIPLGPQIPSELPFVRPV